MKKLLFLVIIGLFISSCDLNKEERNELANNIADVKRQIQDQENAIEKLQSSDLKIALSEIEQLENSVHDDLVREKESTLTPQLFRTVDEREADIERLNKHIREYDKKLSTANSKKESILHQIKNKKDSIESLQSMEIEYQRQLDMLN